MKKLRSNFTTPEQSKRLLDLGVPADSADCYYDHYKNLEVRVYGKLESSFFDTYTRFTPCWSVGQLIEVYEICTGQVWQNEIIENYSKIDMLLEDFEDVEKKYRFDFLKLDE